MEGIPRQLHMVWPVGRRPQSRDMSLPAGYVFREATDGDVEPFRALMKQVDLGSWDRDSLAAVRGTIIPHGWLVVVHEPSSALVATGMGQHRPVEELYPDGYEVGWIAVRPSHSGRRLGRAITAAVTDLLLRHGAQQLYLRTDDFRLSALKTYLALGFLPHLYASDMPARWQNICRHIGMPFTPESWPDRRHVSTTFRPPPASSA